MFLKFIMIFEVIFYRAFFEKSVITFLYSLIFCFCHLNFYFLFEMINFSLFPAFLFSSSSTNYSYHSSRKLNDNFCRLCQQPRTECICVSRLRWNCLGEGLRASSKPIITIASYREPEIFSAKLILFSYQLSSHSTRVFRRFYLAVTFFFSKTGMNTQ